MAHKGRDGLCVKRSGVGCIVNQMQMKSIKCPSPEIMNSPAPLGLATAHGVGILTEMHVIHPEFGPLETQRELWSRELYSWAPSGKLSENV